MNAKTGIEDTTSDINFAQHVPLSPSRTQQPARFLKSYFPDTYRNQINRSDPNAPTLARFHGACAAMFGEIHDTEMIRARLFSPCHQGARPLEGRLKLRTGRDPRGVKR
ncbi:hypothetical protein AB4874_08735 [Thioclava sp. 15-R06ZXC-3]|uniref:Uncharacterized protein n=1 Tax=Thioclava arctica TaxID=3238301 RepID=A0ABV3TJH9_9RHOB